MKLMDLENIDLFSKIFNICPSLISHWFWFFIFTIYNKALVDGTINITHGNFLLISTCPSYETLTSTHEEVNGSG